MTKPQARAQAKALWRAADPQTLAQWGRAMGRATLALPQWQQADTVFCFVSTPAEPDTLPLLQQALAQGKRLLVPRVLPGGGMEAVHLPDLQALRPGAYGILEPDAQRLPTGLPAAALPANALAVIPCLAADRNGVRLGRGGGYYDRFLAGYTGRRLLWCPQALLFDSLPADTWDVRFAAHETVTEDGPLARLL